MQQLNEVKTWWDTTTPEIRAGIQIGAVLFLALVCGHFLAALAKRTLRANNFDAVLRLPGGTPAGTPAGAESQAGMSPTWIAGMLVRLTVWAGAAWWLANQNGRTDIAATIGLVVSRTWALAGVIIAVLGLGNMLARRLMECLQGPGALGSRNGSSTAARGAGAVGAAVYIVVTLLVLLIAADLFDWPLTRSSTLALWQLAHNLFVAGAAVFIGSLGARWARELATMEGPATTEKKAGQYTALGIVAATTILAVAVLLSSAGVLIGLAALAILGFLLWLVRGYLPDIAAGLQLRAHKIREVWFEGAAWQVTEVGFLTSQVGRQGEFHSVQNRLVLEARFQANGNQANHQEQEMVGSR